MTDLASLAAVLALSLVFAKACSPQEATRALEVVIGDMLLLV